VDRASRDPGSVSPERRDPLPGLLSLPGFLLARLSPRARIAVVLGALAVLAGAAAGVSALIREGARQAAGDRATESERDALRRRTLAEDQRPRRAPAPGGLASADAPDARLAVQRAITGDVRKRVHAGLLDGPVAATSCEAIGAPRRRGAAGFNCFTLRTTRKAGYTIESGYRFSARVDAGRGSLAWCKRNPRPIHPDTGYFVTVPVSRACLP